MTINSLKELNKLITLCRKHGVEHIKIDNLELKLGDVVASTTKTRRQVFIEPAQEVYIPGGIDMDTKIDTPDELTPDQLLFYSANAISESV